MNDSTPLNNPNDELARYQALVERRAQLDREIAALLNNQENARAAHMPRYRELARERDEILSEIRALEQGLRLDE